MMKTYKPLKILSMKKYKKFVIVVDTARSIASLQNDFS